MPVALITGAAGDIGRATAMAFRATGYRLVLLDRRKAEFAEACDLALECDIADPASVASAVSHVDRHFGHLDALVNVAGILSTSQGASWWMRRP